MGRRARLTLAALLCAASALAACGGDPASPEHAEAEQAWENLRREPSSGRFKRFRAANLAAARAHGEMHDRMGVLYQVRAFEAQADEAARLVGADADADEAARLAFEVTDAVDDLVRKDLLAAYDEVLPGAADRLRAARDQAAKAASR